MTLEQRTFNLIPARTRKVILALLVRAAVASAVAIGVLVAYGARDSVVIAVVEIFRISAIAAALWFFFLMGQKAQSRGDLLGLTSQVLEDDIPASIRSYALLDQHRSRDATAGGAREDVRIEVTHVPGSTHARYRINWFGLVQDVHLQLNVRQVSIIYFFPEEFHDAIEAQFEDLAAGPRAAEWVVQKGGVRRDARDRGGACFAEFRARRKLAADFLHDPSERLFVSNDIAAMTRSMANWRAREPVAHRVDRPSPSQAVALEASA